MNYNKKIPILEETSFQEHKIASFVIFNKYQYFDKNKAQKMLDCGCEVFFGEKKKLEKMKT